MKAYFQNDSVTLYHGDCFDILPTLAPGSFDAAITDPPYGMTNCSWDRKIDMCALHEAIRRRVKINAAVLIFGVMPFACDVINANRREFHYEIIWRKTQALGFLNAKKMPLRAHENILVFYRRLPTYNPQKYQAPMPKFRIRKGVNGLAQERFNRRPSDLHEYVYCDDGTRYPHDVVDFSSWNGMRWGQRNADRHPTSKPVPLLEYLIATYTNEGETILDPFAGAGTAGVAAMRTGRKAVLIELEKKYCEMAAKRLDKEPLI